jgi:hypothetical protein
MYATSIRGPKNGTQVYENSCAARLTMLTQNCYVRVIIRMCKESRCEHNKNAYLSFYSHQQLMLISIYYALHDLAPSKSQKDPHTCR